MNFDARNVNPNSDRKSGDFDPLPDGWYHMVITGAEATMAKNNPQENGEMLKLTLDIDANEHPEYAGRKIFHYIKPNHVKQTPRAIGQRHLSQILHALSPDDPTMVSEQELLGGRVHVKLKIRKGKDGYSDSNDVVNYGFGGDDEPEQQPEPIPPRQSRPGGWKR